MKRLSRTSPVADQLAVLSDAVRLRLLRVLERQELSVGELARVVQLPQSTVSRHLRVLSDGQWLLSRPEGTSTLYRLVMDELTLAARSLWATVRDQLDQTGENAGDLHRLHSVIAERRTDTRSFFGRVAGEWDSVRNALFGDRFTVPAMLSLLPREWVVADLGCGTGNVAEILAPVVKEVIAVDQSGPMLDAARKRLGEITAKRVRFVESDLEHLPLADASVDAAICVLVLHHIEDPSLVIAEMKRIVRPGGVVLVVDMIRHEHAEYKQTMGHRWLGFGEAQISDLAKSVGLMNPRVLSVPTDVDAKGPALFAMTAIRP